MIKRIILYTFLFLVLTVVSQVGGLLLIVSLGLHYLFIRNKGWEATTRRLAGGFLFAGIYLIALLFLVPQIAKQQGRVPIPIVSTNKTPASSQVSNALLFRNYVNPEVLQLLYDVGRKTQIRIKCLDANLPFLDEFPLIPHLSHDDGEKVDIAFIYKNATSGDRAYPISFFGYGREEGPRIGEQNTAQSCRQKGHWQYGLITQLVPDLNSKIVVDEEQTIRLLQHLAEHRLTGKLFLEPHLEHRWGLSQYDKVRFHGCKAVRHDDHIHLQL